MITLLLLTSFTNAAQSASSSFHETQTETTEMEKIREELGKIQTKKTRAYGFREKLGGLSNELKKVIDGRNTLVDRLNQLIKRAQTILPSAEDVPIATIQKFEKELEEIDTFIKFIDSLIKQDKGLLDKEKTAWTRFGPKQKQEVQNILNEEKNWKEELKTIVNLWGRWLKEVHEELKKNKNNRQKTKSLYDAHKEMHEKVLNQLQTHHHEVPHHKQQ